MVVFRMSMLVVYFLLLSYMTISTARKCESFFEKYGESAPVWPTDPICGFVAATNIATSYSEWSCNASGSTTSDPCTWAGLTCESNGEITILSVEGSSLTGTLTPLLGNIPSLKAINVQLSDISGSLPSSWSSLTMIRTMDLSQNSLYGILPSSWGSLTEMKSLNLYQNCMSGTLPSSWGSLTAIITLWLDQNSFTGTIPSSWSSLSMVDSIDLSENCLTGSLPSSWNLLTAIKGIDISQNMLSGTLPSSWSSLTAISTLVLYQNSLTGTLPASWSSLADLNTLYLIENSLTGTLPFSWSALTTLKNLGLNFNSLSGSLPSSWSSLSGMNNCHLGTNCFSGTLPSSWSSLSTMKNLFLYSNSLTGSLPYSWGSFTSLLSMDVSQNALSGSLPSTWGSLTNLVYIDLNGNSLSGLLPTSWSALARLNELSLFNNYLSGSLTSTIDSMVALQYIYINDNSFSGRLPTAWASEQLGTIDVSGNMLTGSLSANQTAYPVHLQSLDIAFNSLTGTVPPAVALFGNISYLNVSNNDGIVGSIPSEFCSSSGVSIDVTNTGIECYAGCLTSSFVLIEGASSDCHDGSIMGRFMIIAGVTVGSAVVCTLLYCVYIWWSPTIVSMSSTMLCGVCTWCTGAGRVSTEAKSSNASSSSRVASGSFTIFFMAVAKFLLGLVLALVIDNWWTYSGDRSLHRNNEILATCSNPTVGSCFSFCGDVQVVTVDITTDDIVFDDVYSNNPTANVIDHVQSSSYCIATLPGYCGYEVWIDLKLLPILLQSLCVILQILLMWRYGPHQFSGTPQRAQYDLILTTMYPHVGLGSDASVCIGSVQQEKVGVNSPPAVTFGYRLKLLNRLATPLFPSVFWFLELVTVVYVWGELVFPPVYCGSVPPLSLYYYPILMSLLDLMKLNIYTSVELWQAKRHLESILILLDLQLFFTHMWVTVAMGLIYFAGVIRDSILGLIWCVDAAIGRQEKLGWAIESKTADVVEVPTSISRDTCSAAAVNPIFPVDPNDVELARVVSVTAPEFSAFDPQVNKQ